MINDPVFVNGSGRCEIRFIQAGLSFLSNTLHILLILNDLNKILLNWGSHKRKISVLSQFTFLA